MKRNISHLLYIVAIGFFTSCSDFLDVAPVSYTHLTLPTIA